MSLLVLCAAAAAGGMGAALRYLVDTAVSRWVVSRWPWGVLVINVTGSFLLGLIAGAVPEALFIVGVGFLGGYTTFSTAMVDTVVLWREGERRAAVGNAVGMLVLAVAAAALGLGLARL
ncbi:fluoride efflux transporter FluC [Microbacterium sp. YY-01]|uniref:fluoride efflux transporter FluC n=1 Tax=Microbacterium sp. YY-01 TaxID=3421634 RepID=UPI003D18101F